MTRMVDLSDLVREIVPVVQAGIAKQVEVELVLAPGLPAIQADASQMQQIVTNLLLNGAEAIGEHKPGKVRVATSARDGAVLLEVTDTAGGMTEEMMAPVQEIIRSHQGTIALKSTPGAGTTVLLTFPGVEKKMPESVAAAPNRQQELRGSGTILVVDDEKPVRTLFRKILERYGYEVLVAEDGQIATNLFAENHERISLVILDWAMPVLNGPETLQRLQRIAPRVPVIVSSGYAETDAVGQCGTAFAGFVQKPFKPQQLLEQIQSVVRSAAQTTKGALPFGLASAASGGPAADLETA